MRSTMYCVVLSKERVVHFTGRIANPLAKVVLKMRCHVVLVLDRQT